MKRIFVAALVAFFLTTRVLAQQPQSDRELVDYVWPYGKTTIGRLRVPEGFTTETQNYTEGIITHLRYPDGSFIVLHWGGMMKLPLLDEPAYVLRGEQRRADRNIRIGVSADGERYWREDAFPPRQEIFSLNIGFGNVSADKLDLFNDALDSYQRISREAPPN